MTVNHHPEPVVTTAQGAVRGLRQDGPPAFLNPPSPPPPRGPGRFPPPQPHEPWDGIRDATVPGPNAPQSERKLGSVDMSPYFGTGWSRGEDYLTVNVFTPAAAGGDLPVMVFVHGGGFVAGSTRSALSTAPPSPVMASSSSPSTTGWASPGSSTSPARPPTAACSTSSPRCA